MKKFKHILYLAPATVFFIAFVLIPIVYTVYLSFFDWNMVSPVKEFVGLDNYIDVLTDPNIHKITWNTLLYIAIMAFTNFFVAYVFAFVCKFILNKFQKVYKIILFLPGFISLIVASTIFIWILNPLTGPVSILFEFFGMDMPIWSTTQGLIIVVISLITTWGCFGYNFITLFAAVSSVPKEVIEAAKLDNIPMYKIFYKIVIPMSSASGYYILIMTMMQALSNVFGPIDVISTGGPDYGSSNLVYESYVRAFTLFETGQSATISVLTIILFAVIVLILNKTVGKKVYYAG